MKKMKNIHTNEISYIDEKDFNNKYKSVKKYKVMKDKELKDNLVEVK